MRLIFKQTDLKNAKRLHCTIKVTYSELLKRNSDNKENYDMLIKAHKMDPFKENYEDNEMQTIIKLLEGTSFCLFSRAGRIVSKIAGSFNVAVEVYEG